jgi:hypothetical protein
LYHDGHRTQSINSVQIVSGLAAISIVFCAKTFDVAGECCGGQRMRESGICTLCGIEESPISRKTLQSPRQTRAPITELQASEHCGLEGFKLLALQAGSRALRAGAPKNRCRRR